MYYYRGFCVCDQSIKVPLTKEVNQYVFRGTCNNCGEIYSIIVKESEIQKYIDKKIIFLEG